MDYERFVTDSFIIDMIINNESLDVFESTNPYTNIFNHIFVVKHNNSILLCHLIWCDESSEFYNGISVGHWLIGYDSMEHHVNYSF